MSFIVDDDNSDYYSYSWQSYDPEIESPNDMIVDPDEFVVEPESERDDVAIINPDQDGDQAGLPRADDCMYLPFSVKFLDYH